MLKARSGTWKTLLDTVATFGDTRIVNKQMVEDKLKDKGEKNIADNMTEYLTQLYTYLNSYTKGNLNAKLMKVREEGVLEVYRDLVHKGRNMNASRILKMKATVLQPKRAAKAE